MSAGRPLSTPGVGGSGRRPAGMITRWVLASTLAIVLAVAAVALLQVDADIGAPIGPDRLVAAIDGQAAPQASDLARARNILRSSPDDGRAFRVLARSAALDGDGNGNGSQARALYAIAARRAPRDQPTRAALADGAFAAGDLQAGFDQLDALFRVAPNLRDPLLRRLIPDLDDARVQEALVARMATNPPWRAALVPVLLDASTSTPAALDLLARLARRIPLLPAEADARIALLQRAGRDGDARQLWLEALPTSQRGDDARLFDGGFEHPDVTGAYGWRLDPPPGVAITSDDTNPAQGAHALSIDFSGRAVQGPGLSQRLALAPGDYRLSLAVDNATDAQRPFAWRLSCQAPGEPLLSLSLPDGSRRGWQQVAADFSVPAGCTGQTLHLDFLARSIAERQLTGSLRLDAMRIANR
ncbi:hypothetical protein [Cognatiluteimonas profundi]|uniref:hypothetical protein n=1 Tax=Cognatiluteimonas profundi TaxID=2594501 RepID=UPI00131D974A|nr:hypothetical protein [Lysobacter profundi]